MKTFAYTVRPKIPEKLKPLEELANNLWLSWDFDAVNLFMRLDDEAWARSRQNPALFSQAGAPPGAFQPGPELPHPPPVIHRPLAPRAGACTAPCTAPGCA